MTNIRKPLLSMVQRGIPLAYLLYLYQTHRGIEILEFYWDSIAGISGTIKRPHTLSIVYHIHTI